MPYALSGKGVIHEFLHDEVIIANLEAGIYYSIRGSGIVIWQLLLAGNTISAIESLFAEKYGSTSSVASFVERLVDERLLISIDSASASIPSLVWPAAFEPPLLDRYDEMKHLLMLDPIHEVDEQGWPHQK